MKRIKLILGASILLLSAQVNAGIISDANPLEGAELWEYSVVGSVFYGPSGNYLPIFGSMLIDTTVRLNDLASTYPPSPEICDCPVLLDIVSFDLRIGGLSFFGGNPPPNIFGSGFSFTDDLTDISVSSWHLIAADDSETIKAMYGIDFSFYDSDGTNTSVAELYAGIAPAIIELRDCCGFDLVDGTQFPARGGSIFLTRVARVPEPSAILLFGIGLIGLVGFSKRRKVS